MSIEDIVKLLVDKAPWAGVILVFAWMFFRHLKSVCKDFASACKEFASTIKNINDERRDDQKRLQTIIEENTRQTAQCALVLNETKNVLQRI